MSKSHELSNFIWSIADLLRGHNLGDKRRDFENVPLKENVTQYFEREVLREVIQGASA